MNYVGFVHHHLSGSAAQQKATLAGRPHGRTNSLTLHRASDLMLLALQEARKPGVTSSET